MNDKGLGLLAGLLFALCLCAPRLGATVPQEYGGLKDAVEYRVRKGDSLLIEIQAWRGDLQWQKSDDGISWQTWRDQVGPRLLALADGEQYIRLQVSDGDCRPVHTSVVHVVTFDLPVVVTHEIGYVMPAEAGYGGSVISDGGDPVTARGICWSTDTLPTLDGSFTNNGTGTGDFGGALTGLTPETTYHIRAYATNGAGTAYGEDKPFTTTRAATLPTIVTAEVTEITSTSATCGGDVTDEGGTAVQVRGVCWNTTGNPTVQDNVTVDGSGFGPFTSLLTGLTPATTYFVRAYATKCVGTAYGEVRQFTTGQ